MHQRIHQFRHGIGIGRNVDARAEIPHLMFVEPELRKPVVVHRLIHVLGFDLGEHVPIAIVIVAYVVVIEIRHFATFVLGAEIFAIPLGDHDLAVRIEGRDKKNDDIIQSAYGFGVLRGDELVGPFHGHLAGTDL